MKFSLLPKSNLFYELLEELALKAEEAVALFAVVATSWSPSHPGIQQLRDLEHACDEIVKEIMVKLNKTFITPIDREDIHLLCKNTDDLADLVQSISERMLLFQIQSVRQEFQDMTSLLRETVAIVVKVIRNIKDLKRSHELIQDCITIKGLENRGDRLFETALGNLFIHPTDPLEVIKWKELYDFLEMAVDKCDDIADIIWGIVVKYG